MRLLLLGLMAKPARVERSMHKGDLLALTSTLPPTLALTLPTAFPTALASTLASTLAPALPPLLTPLLAPFLAPQLAFSQCPTGYSKTQPVHTPVTRPHRH